PALGIGPGLPSLSELAEVPVGDIPWPTGQVPSSSAPGLALGAGHGADAPIVIDAAPPLLPPTAPGSPPGEAVRPPKSRGLQLVWTSIGLALGLTAAVLFLGRQIALPEGGSKKHHKPYELTPASEVVLLISPSEAIVVGEQDGRILGTSPLTFLVPPGVETALLVTAPDREPQRVVLPDRGTASVTLQRPATTCAAEVTPPPGVTIERVDTPATATATSAVMQVQGAAIVRAKSGGAGAWLVACAAGGGRVTAKLAAYAKHEDLRIHIAEPSNMLFFADGRLGGPTPSSTNVEPGFTSVRIQTVEGPAIERWVPVFNSVVLKMPVPEPPLEGER
ncbi:hypothetical protein L6R52_37570, partial [Myxococcota bacterium]|nr:hypothetical protein [Myxococcota bacterium]